MNTDREVVHGSRHFWASERALRSVELARVVVLAGLSVRRSFWRTGNGEADHDVRVVVVIAIPFVHQLVPERLGPPSLLSKQLQ